MIPKLPPSMNTCIFNLVLSLLMTEQQGPCSLSKKIIWRLMVYCWICSLPMAHTSRNLDELYQWAVIMLQQQWAFQGSWGITRHKIKLQHSPLLHITPWGSPDDFEWPIYSISSWLGCMLSPYIRNPRSQELLWQKDSHATSSRKIHWEYRSIHFQQALLTHGSQDEFQEYVKEINTDWVHHNVHVI